MVVFFYSTIWGLFCHCPFLLDLFRILIALLTLRLNSGNIPFMLGFGDFEHL